jgi:hypothetical protein
MATDPALLTDWYKSYTQANPKPAAPVGAPAGTPTADQQQAPVAQPGQPAQQPTGMLGSTAPAAKLPTADPTVQGQLKNVLDAGGPLMDRATTRAAQQVNARGLLNSSIGIGAGQAALYDAAMPIASQDAGTFKDIGMQQSGFAQQNKLQDSDFAQQSKIQTADLASRYDLAQMDVQSREKLQAKDIENQQKLQQANAALQTGLQATDNAVKQSMQQYDGALKVAMQGTDNATRLQLATLDADNRMALANLEAKYKNELQANQSMASSYQSMVDSFTRVMLDPNLDAAGKEAATKNLTGLYNNTLAMQADVSGLQLGQLLAPEAFAAVPASPAAPAAAPAAAPVAAPAPAPASDYYGWNMPGSNSYVQT